MNKNEQNKFEQLASLFHHDKMADKETQNARDESGLTEDADFSAVKGIFEAKVLVGQASKITPPAKAWKKVHSRISRRHLLRNIVYLQYAAAVVAIILTIRIFADKNIRRYFSYPEQFNSVISPADEIKNLKLDDGTTVWLNSGSVLKYSSSFGKTNRQVIIEGEALFKVVKDNKHPFTVSLGHSKVIVHGTTFNVKGYSADDKCEVVLIEGSVEYINSRKNIFIKPGERITEIRSSTNLVVDQVDTVKYISWTSGKVYFDNQTLLDLVTVLEKWYDIEFEFTSDTTKSYKFTGMITRDNSLDYTLQIIGMTNKVKFLKKGGKILITN